MEKYLLRLFVTGPTARSQRAIANLKRICDEQLAGKYDLEVIDILANPNRAEESHILATPTVIKELPPPVRRIIGDLSDTEKVLVGLDLQPRSKNTTSQQSPA